MDKAAGDTCLIRGFLTEGLSQVLCGRFFSVIAVLCLLGMGSRVTMAQTLGQRPYVAPEPIELGFVESATGNLHLEIPMGSFPQRASSQPMKYFMAYDSNFWTITPSNVWSPASPLPFAGWRTVAHQWQSITYNIYSILCLRQYNNFQAVDNVGTVHFFPVTTAMVINGCSGNGTSSGDAFATDSSGYHLYVTNYTDGKVYAPDGTLAYQWPTVTDAHGNSIDMEDPNGNYFGRSLGGPNVSGYIDTLGRQSFQPWQQVMNSRGGYTSYGLVSATIPLKTSFGQSGITECTTNCTALVIQTINLADGTSYQFKYDCDSGTGNLACGSPSGQSGYYGTLISVTLPTGGQINYGYTTFSDSYGNRSRWLSSRTSAGAIWSYYPQVISTCSSSQVGCQEKLTVYKPSGASTVYTFTLNNGVWPGQIQSYDVAGNSVETVTTTFDFSNSCALQGCVGAGYIRPTSKSTTVPIPGGTSLSRKTSYAYDSPQKGNVTAVSEWKFYPGTSPSFPSIPDRATYTTFLAPTGINIINKPLTSTVCNNSGSDADCPGGGSKVSQTKIAYDSYGTNNCGGPSGLVPVTGIANHDDTNFGAGNLARANPTQLQKWVSGSNYLVTTLLYDTTGQLAQSMDPAGNTTCYSYADNFFNETGASSMSAYSPPSPTNAYLKTVTRGGLTATFGYYYGSGKLAISTDPNNVTTSNFYSDVLDRHTTTNFPIGWNLTNYTSQAQADSYVPVADTSPSSSCISCRDNQVNLDVWGRKVNQKLVNAPGGAINVDTTYDATGRIQSVSHAYVNPSDPSHVFETFAYDGLDRTIAVTHPDNQSLRTAYGPNVSNLGGVTTQQGSPSTYGYGYPVISMDEVGKQRQQWIDGFGRIIEVDEPSLGNTQSTGSVTIGGTEQSFVTQRCTRWLAGGDCANWVNVTTYDTGTVSITVNGFSKSTTYGSTSTSSTIASALATAFNGDTNSPVTASVSGNVVSLTSKASGPGTNYSLSAGSSTNDPADFGGPSFYAATSGTTLVSLLTSPAVTLYSYDAAERLAQVIEGGQTRTFNYDGLGRLTSRTTPEAGTDNFYFTQSDNVTLCAGEAGAVCRRTDARNITATYNYDSLNRVTGKTYSNGQGAVTYQYDQGGASAFALGRLTKMLDPSGSETYIYNQMGWVIEVLKTVDRTTYPIIYQYNVGGDVTQITYPSNRVVQRNLDNIGRLQTLGPAYLGTNFVSIPAQNGYNAAGQVLTLTYGNNVTANFSYSAARQQMTGVSYANPFQTLFSLNYYYQKDQTNCSTGTTGNNGQIDCIADGVDSGRTVSYTYDALGRLSTAVTNGSTGFPQWGLSETFDRYGNRLSQNQTAGAPPYNTLSFGTTPPANGAYTNHPDGYSFDPSGNMLNDGNNTLVYDAENCLISSTNSSTGTSAYTCDAHGVRLKKVLQDGTPTVYIFADGKDIAEYSNGPFPPIPSSPLREYIYAGGQLVATISPQNNIITYHHSDHLSVRVTTDGGGNKIGEQGHYPYGETWYTSNTTTKFIFTSYERDSESGNDYAMARYYINRFGRFSCVDPVLGRPSDPQSWNRYAYARNDPVNITDPSGQSWLSWLFKVILTVLAILLRIPALATIPIPGAGGIPLGTPPIVDNGTLSSTTATLNSIYNPIDPGKFGINNFMLSPPTVNAAFIDDCAKALFGVALVSFTPAKGKSSWGGGTPQNGSFTGAKAGIPTGPNRTAGPFGDDPGPYQFTVTYDVSRSRDQVNSMWRNDPRNTARNGVNPPPGSFKIPAYTDGANPYVNIGSYDYNLVQGQVWELGNSLGFITGMGERWNGETDYSRTNEPGKAMWECYINHK